MKEFEVYDVVPWDEQFDTEGAKVIYVKWHEVRKEDCCCSVWRQKISQEQNQIIPTLKILDRAVCGETRLQNDDGRC